GYNPGVRFDRRIFLKSAAAGVASLAIPGCRSTRSVPPAAGANSLPGCHPVHVLPEREIRTIAGLRPFRPSGFVVRSETLGDTVVIHNYGHGGGGITLS